MASLYLHIPFCEHKCIYCDFYSIAPKDSTDAYGALIERFLFSLAREITMRGDDPAYRVPYDTVFFGGGTPSLLPPSKIGEILDRLSGVFSLQPDAELTLETNPGTVGLEKLRDFRSSGINRLSVGVQSFHDDELKFLTRIHSSEEAKECVRNAFSVGFNNVSIDLIFALPSQTLERWQSTLDQALDLGPTHLSCYSLIVEPKTPLSRMVQAKQVTLLGPETDAEMYEFTIEYLRDHGYEQYEVSNFAKPGYRSRHNRSYWNHSDYLGFGPSAHSFWGRKRWWNIAHTVGYAERLEKGVFPVAGEEELTKEQLHDEAVFLGLRSDGIDVAGFRKRFQKDLLVEHKSTIDHLLASNLAIHEEGRLRLTAKGYSLCDEICFSFLS